MCPVCRMLQTGHTTKCERTCGGIGKGIFTEQRFSSETACLSWQHNVHRRFQKAFPKQRDCSPQYYFDDPRLFK